MSELDRTVQNRIRSMFSSRAFVVNGRGDVSIDGVTLQDGPEGKRAAALIEDSIRTDIEELGSVHAQSLYNSIVHLRPTRLGKTLAITVKQIREYDSDEIAGR